MTINEMSHKQATTLAAFLHELRTDWDAPGITSELGKARTMAPAAELAVAAIKAAKDRKNRTPAVIGLDGPHWRSSDTAPKPPTLTRDERRARTCDTCGRLDGCTPPAHDFTPLDQATRNRAPVPADLRENK